MLFKREDVDEVMAAGQVHLAELPIWIKIVLPILFITYIFGQAAIQYVYGCVLTVLAAIESPDHTVVVRTPPTDDPDAPLPPYSDKPEDVKEPDVKEPLVQEEVLLITSKPVTASTRGTLRHLRSKGTNGLRGLGVGFIFFFAFHFITSVWTAIFSRGAISQAFAVLIATVLTTRLGLLWTHTVISEKSEKWWYQRLVDRKVGRKAVLPTLAVMVAHFLVPVIPMFFIWLLNVPVHLGKPLNELSNAERTALTLKSFVVALSGIAFFIAVVVPMCVALIRVYASLLPENESPIVPFDRTFGGLVLSEAEGGKGVLSLKAAWKSFDWNGRMRLIKIWVKMTAYLFIINILFFVGLGITMAGHYVPKMRNTVPAQ